MEKGDFIKRFQDLDVYQRLYRLMLQVHREILPVLPKEEKFNLIDQMRRASQAAPALLAEGFAKRFQPRAWSRYIDDAIGESQEMIHHVSTARDLYQPQLISINCGVIIDEYEVCIKQLSSLGSCWRTTHIH